MCIHSSLEAGISRSVPVELYSYLTLMKASDLSVVMSPSGVKTHSLVFDNLYFPLSAALKEHHGWRAAKV